VCHVYVFFFTSRRRHTRFSRDWSSDVCSSDLQFLISSAAPIAKTETTRVEKANIIFSVVILIPLNGSSSCKAKCGPIKTGDKKRSEERRGGKEGRAGERTYDEKQHGEW